MCFSPYRFANGDRLFVHPKKKKRKFNQKNFARIHEINIITSAIQIDNFRVPYMRACKESKSVGNSADVTSKIKHFVRTPIPKPISDMKIVQNCKQLLQIFNAKNIR